MKTLWFTDALVCTPLALLLFACIYAYFEIVPTFERAEINNAIIYYREIAQTVKDGEVSGIREYSARDRKSEGRLSKGSWGYERRNDKTLVWYRAPKAERVRGVLVAPIVPRDVYTLFIIWSAIILGIVVLITDFGLRRFRALAKERENFIAAVSHDLKTPIAALQMLIGNDNPEALEVLGRMHHLIANLNDFLRQGKPPKLEIETFDLAEAFHDAYHGFEQDFAEAESGAIEIIAPPAPIMVTADRQLTMRIFWNLIGNALKYAAPYGKVYAKFSPGTAELIDEGPGMSWWERRHAFKRTYRANNKATRCKGGFGLGLANARQFARAMRGELTLQANHPRGCVFALHLPA